MKLTKELFFNFVRKSQNIEIYSDPETWTLETKHYLQGFDTKPNNRLFFSWNWAAFLFRETWFILRKMYFYAFLCTIIPISLIFGLLSLMSFSDSIFSIPILFICILVIVGYFMLPGLLGDSLYISWVKKKISKNISNQSGVTLIGGILAWFLWPTVLSVFFWMASLIKYN